MNAENFSNILEQPDELVTVNTGKVLFSNQIFEIRLDYRLRPPWMVLDNSKRFIYISKLFQPVKGDVLAWLCKDGRKYPAVVRQSGKIIFNFDIEQTITRILREQYLAKKRPLMSRLPFHHHRFPASVRVWVLKTLNKLKQGKVVFPSWPADNSVDLLRFMFMQAFQLVSKEQLKKTKKWPLDVKSIVCLSHDVDTIDAARNIEKVAFIEEEFNLKSTWFITGNKLSQSKKTLNYLHDNGNEIALHGHNHDFKLPFLKIEEIEQRLKIYRVYMEDYNMTGFRSPGMLRTTELLKVLATYFRYDSTFVDTERYSFTTPGEGCCTVFPFNVGPLLEIPVTLPMDISLAVAGLSEQQMLELWLRKIRLIKQIGGVAVLNTHTDSHLSAQPSMLKIYQKLLDTISQDKSLKVATLNKVAGYWKRRDED